MRTILEISDCVREREHLIFLSSAAGYSTRAVACGTRAADGTLPLSLTQSEVSSIFHDAKMDCEHDCIGAMQKMLLGLHRGTDMCVHIGVTYARAFACPFMQRKTAEVVKHWENNVGAFLFRSPISPPLSLPFSARACT